MKPGKAHSARDMRLIKGLLGVVAHNQKIGDIVFDHFFQLCRFYPREIRHSVVILSNSLERNDSQNQQRYQ